MCLRILSSTQDVHELVEALVRTVRAGVPHEAKHETTGFVPGHESEKQAMREKAILLMYETEVLDAADSARVQLLLTQKVTAAWISLIGCRTLNGPWVIELWSRGRRGIKFIETDSEVLVKGNSREGRKKNYGTHGVD